MSKKCVMCSQYSEDSAIVCEVCNASFLESADSDPRNSSAPLAILELADSESDMIIKINGDGVLGREGTIEREFFARHRSISRKHCGVSLKHGNYLIEHLPSAMHPTILNQYKLVPGVPMIIRDGDSLRIADKLFTAAIRTEAAQHDAAPPASVAQAEESPYIIVCQLCGEIYPVFNRDDRIKECHQCDDYDKYDIAKVPARER